MTERPLHLLLIPAPFVALAWAHLLADARVRITR